MTAQEFGAKYEGQKVRILHVAYDNQKRFVGQIGYVKGYNGGSQVWVSFDQDMNHSFYIKNLEVIPEKILPLPLPG